MIATYRSILLVLCSLAAFALSGCNSGTASPFIGPTPIVTPTPVPATQAGVRAVHASPNAPNVDVYVYTMGQMRPTTPSVANLAFKTITPYLALNPGTYTVDIEAAGSVSTTPPLATENVTVVGGINYSVVVAGEVGTTVQFMNFIEPTTVVGQSALIVHHASPFVGSAINPVGIGIYDAAAVPGTPSPGQTVQLFSFAFTPGTSGPAASGSVSGGEFYVSPVPSGIPATLGLAAGAPGTNGGPLASVVVATPLTGVIAQEIGIGATTHDSLFAIDASATSATIIGTIDP